ncbi:type IV toxin-antitoxin system AbiEi family antitoxin domain-containing protein [Microbacterium sp.]|uniref:type IV toxin-antitoxin system AbiEi family antitoxin domain-containing protein n=1 Tax=Microbacterium sp. TaxID=51671 RepID=UPI003A921E9C
MRAVDALETLELLGSTQRGLVTAAQARAARVSGVELMRLADAGKVTRARHGVYALPSAGVDPLQDLRAAWLAASANGDVVVSGASAAVVHDLGDVVAAHHEFTSAARRQSRQPDVRFRRASLHTRDVTLVDGLPVTTVVRTAADLARASLDRDHLAGVLVDAIEDPEVDVAELAKALDPSASRYGAVSGTALLIAVAPNYPNAELRSAVRRSESLSPRFRAQMLDMMAEPEGLVAVLSALRAEQDRGHGSKAN